MKRIINLRQILFGACIAGSLAFGTTAAAAGPAAPCNNPLAEGSCRSLSDCQSLCGSRGFDPSASVCRDRCCFCNAI